MSTRQRCFFLIVVALSLYVLEPLWMPLAAGLVLAYLCEEPSYKIYERFNITKEWQRFGVAIAIVALVSAVFIAPLLLLTWSATTELIAFYGDMSGGVSAVETGHKLMAWLDSHLTPILEKADLNFRFEDISKRLQAGIEPALKNAAMQVADILSGTPAVLLFVAVCLMAWTYFLVHGRAHRRTLLPLLIPWPEERDIICDTMSEILRALVLTSIVLSIAQSLLVAFTLGLTGVPKYYLWAALAFFLSFIPVFGTAPVMLGGAIYCFTHDKNVAGFVILGMAVFIGSVDNIIRPWLMKGSTELNFFWLFMALVGGIAVFGAPGAVIGPWAFAMFSAIQQKNKQLEMHS